MELRYLTVSRLFIFLFACVAPEKNEIIAEQWKETELTFHATETYSNSYTEVDMWVEFTRPDGEKLIRLGFWHEGSTWKVRFASPVANGAWQWKSFSSVHDKGLAGKSGSITAKPYTGNNPLISKGLLRMSPGKRTVIHANGKPFLMNDNTPWALLWRGIIVTVNEYAHNLQVRGFNAARLISLMPFIAATWLQGTELVRPCG